LHVARYTNAAGKNKTLNIPATLRSADDTQRGAVSGKILIVFPKGTNCSFSNSALDKKDPGYSALKTAVAGITVVGIPTSGSTRGFGGERRLRHRNQAGWAYPNRPAGQPRQT
jgi:hypothetical protein